MLFLHVGNVDSAHVDINQPYSLHNYGILAESLPINGQLYRGSFIIHSINAVCFLQVLFMATRGFRLVLLISYS